jgi:hypothetical protein
MISRHFESKCKQKHDDEEDEELKGDEAGAAASRFNVGDLRAYPAGRRRK